MDRDLADRLLRDVFAIAAHAGEAILDVYAGTVTPRYKADHSPVTEADHRAHDVIAAALQSLDPRLPLLSEEADAAPWEVRRGWSRYWLVDPLDGTREFLDRNGEFTVNIALVEEGRPVLGVVHSPVRGAAWGGSKGLGAWRREAGRSERIAVASAPTQPPRVLASRSHRGASLDRFLSRLGEHRLVVAGSALKFGLLAEGGAEVYPRFGPTSEWDTAAGQAVVEAAGGAVLTMDGRPLACNGKEGLLNPDFIACADPGRDWLSFA